MRIVNSIMISLKKIKYLIEGKYLFIRTIHIQKKWYGNNYGGFYLAENSLKKPSIVYSFGIGEDISFDEEIIKKIGCKIFAYDPTPKSVSWVKENVKSKEFIFTPIGIAKEKGVKKFYLPENKNHVSGSINVLKTTRASNSIELEFDNLTNMMVKNKHKRIDLLKMDIEGAEYEVIDFIKENNINISQILVEFHPHLEKEGMKKTKKAVQVLESMGYRVFARSNSFLEYSFIKVDQ